MDAPVIETQEPTAEALARQCQAGSPEAFARLVERFGGRVFHFLHLRVGHRQDAEDLTQETFLKAYRNLDRYRPDYPFAPWLFTIARRTAATHYRRQSPVPDVPAPEAHPPEDVAWTNPASLAADRDEEQSIWRLARQLKPKQYAALWLRYGEGFELAETARILGLTIVHVKVLLHRARRQLARKLARLEPQPTPSENLSLNRAPAPRTLS